MHAILNGDWVSGNEIDILENGEEYFPALLAAIDGARQEFLFEVYIWREDEIGVALAESLIAAAGRGVTVRATVDGFGTQGFSDAFVERFAAAGIELCSFDTQAAPFGIHTNMFCRMHRKIAVVDRKIAFVGGINIWALHLARYGERSMQDFSVRVAGPIVARIHETVQRGPGSLPASRFRRWRSHLRRRGRQASRPAGDARARFVTRDNRDHPGDIERMYRYAINRAEREIWIACAYFFPGYRFVRDIARAARRGVEVRLILQGSPDVAVSAFAASLLYDHLMAASVRIFHYQERPLHAKVAVIDGVWATVGSSNLDPISLGLNLEANLFVFDASCAGDLRGRLDRLLRNSCREVEPQPSRNRLWRRLLSFVLYHTTRHIPRWGRLILRRRQAVRSICPGVANAAKAATREVRRAG